jgi:DUF4097 and DUF4098 domain-containing protein YvlB
MSSPYKMEKSMSVRAARVLAVCLPLLSLAAHAAEKRLDKTFDVSPGGTLTVDADGSDITVTGSDGNQVAVQIVVKSQGFVPHMDLGAEQTSGGVSVTAKQSGWISLGYMTSSVQVQVPKHYSVELKTSGGDIKVAHLQGNAWGKTSGGDVDVKDVHGPVNMHTSGGDVTVTEIEGKIDIETSGGDVVARTVSGDLDAATSGGGILLEQITGSTRARTSSGDVIARNMHGNVDLHSSGGDIRGAGIDGQIRASTSGGDIDVELLGANRGIYATSSGGSIVLHVPAEIGGVLNASTSGGSIKTELPVTTKDAGERKLTGTINGGGEEILARTSGGNVRLQVRK